MARKTDQKVDLNFLFQRLTVQTFRATSFSVANKQIFTVNHRKLEDISQSCIRNKINCQHFCPPLLKLLHLLLRLQHDLWHRTLPLLNIPYTSINLPSYHTKEPPKWTAFAFLQERSCIFSRPQLGSLLKSCRLILTLLKIWMSSNKPVNAAVASAWWIIPRRDPANQRTDTDSQAWHCCTITGTRLG